MKRKPLSNDRPAIQKSIKIQLPEGRLGLRLALVIVLIALAVGSFALGINSIFSTEAGLAEVSALSGEMNAGESFTFYYYLGYDGTNATDERRTLRSLYTEAATDALELFGADIESETVGLCYISRHPNEDIEVGQALYSAFELLEESGTRYHYLAPLYAQYHALCSSQSDVEAAQYDPRLDLSRYQFPTLDLLKTYDKGSMEINREELEANQRLIKQALEDFNIRIASIKATVGPTVTLYEIVPEAGIRISKIKNLEDDIALSLSALQIRIIAPMPGKGTIGIEVPNKNPQIVSMQSVIASKRFVDDKKCDLPVAIGRTITNEVFMFDLCKTPHLLVAGATGQGKSVGLNAIITSLLYKKHPSELKFVMVDPKMVEFSIYAKIERHYLAKLPNAEKPIVTEMEDRYRLLVSANVRNIKEYNAKFIERRLNPQKGHRFLPYIVAVVDEFADLIAVAGREIDQPISRIAAKARAVGIHMILATQRPDTKVITGTIKSNFPSRIAFKVASMIDSRTILDAPGANRLIGRGDMLIVVAGQEPVRVQCAFVDTPEVEEIVDYIGDQPGFPTAYLLPDYVPEGGESNGSGAVDLSDRDPLFDEVARLVVIQQQGSTSLIQRKFSIGYNRAGRLMDQLEAAGIVGPFEGSKARQVLIPDEYSLEQLLNSLK